MLYKTCGKTCYGMMTWTINQQGNNNSNWESNHIVPPSSCTNLYLPWIISLELSPLNYLPWIISLELSPLGLNLHAHLQVMYYNCAKFQSYPFIQLGVVLKNKYGQKDTVIPKNVWWGYKAIKILLGSINAKETKFITIKSRETKLGESKYHRWRLPVGSMTLELTL